MSQDFVLRGGCVVEADAAPAFLDLFIKDGRIATRMLPGTPVDASIPMIDVAGKHVFPGLIDAHVHFGFGEKITEYSTETAYAAQGGFTSILGYFLNNESYAEVFEREQAYARERALVDYGFHFSVANEEHVRDMASYVRNYGVTSFKYFMNFKGEEGRYLGLDGTDDGYLYNLLETAGKLDGVKVVCHTENIEIVNRLRAAMLDLPAPTLRDWARVKPPFTEAESCIRAMAFAEHFGAHLYIPHLSTRMALDEVRRWRKRYPNVYVETCPHYLTHDDDSTLGALGRANPPFRSKDDVAAMWEGLEDGSIDVVASDHVPRKRATKERPFWLASQGFPGTATILPVLLNEGYHKGRLSLPRIAQVLTEAPSRIFGMAPKKGSLAAGADADLTIVDLERSRVVNAAELGSYSDYSLYDGWTLKGWPVRTIVRGETVMLDGEIVGKAGHGRYLSRPLSITK